MSNPNSGNVLIRLTADEHFIAVSTYCRDRGRRGRFLIGRDWMERLLDDGRNVRYDMDCGNHLRAFIESPPDVRDSTGSNGRP